MLDIAFVREHRELLQYTAEKKEITLSIANLLEQDELRRRLLRDVERLRHERNLLSEQIGELIKQGKHDEAEQVKRQVREANEALSGLETSLAETEKVYRELMLLVPNPVSTDTPDGNSDADNVEIRRVGELPAFEFVPLNHVEIGERLGILDLQRGVKIAGTRNYVLKGVGYHLHRAVQPASYGCTGGT